jgi:hypothetical protein
MVHLDVEMATFWGPKDVTASSHLSLAHVLMMCSLATRWHQRLSGVQNIHIENVYLLNDIPRQLLCLFSAEIIDSFDDCC